MDPYSQSTNTDIDFSGSIEENNYVGSAIDFSGTAIEENNFNYGILLAVSPLICVIIIFIIVLLNFYIYEPLKEYISNIKKKYERKKIEKNLPIYNCKINTFYIKELNKNNFDEVRNLKKKIECSICCEEINIEKFKYKKTNLIFLNCSHVYHTKCLQSWVKTRVNDFIKPDCPYCRGEIVEVKQYQNNKISYDSDISGRYVNE